LIYRANDELLINTHALRRRSLTRPALHLAKTEDGDMASPYINSFDRVWTNA
jgi:hypothetical protein